MATLSSTPPPPHQPSTHSTSNPAHPSSANTNHTTTSGEKPTTAIDSITDPSFLPTLDEAPVAQKAKSHLLLFTLLLGAVFGAWLMGFELFQVKDENASWGNLILGLGAVTGVGGGLLVWTGSHTIDWWDLVAGYWWLSMPVAGAAGLLFVMAQEQVTDFQELD